MTTEVTSTENAAVIPEHWDRDIIEALYDDDSAFSRVSNKSAPVSGEGDIVNVTVAPTLSVKTVGADGAVAAQAPTPTNVQVPVDRHRAILLEWLKSVKKQSFKEWWDMLPSESGKALKEEMENALLAEYSNVTTNTVGDGTGHFDDDMALSAIAKLISAKVPVLKRPDECTFVLDWREFAPLAKQSSLHFEQTGKAGGGNEALSIPRVRQIPTIVTTQITAAAGINHNLLFHRSAFAMAVQQNIDLEYDSGLANRKLTRIFCADVFYGKKTVIEGRAVDIKTVDA